MNTSRSLSRMIAPALAAALVLASPGLPAYEALAAETAAPGALGLPAAGALAPLMRGLPAADPSLSALSLVDLGSAQGRLQVQPVVDAVERLGPGAAPAQAAQAAVLAVAALRAQASGDLSGRDAAALAQAARYPLLLEPSQYQAVQRELSRRKELSARAIVAGANGWENRTAPDGAVAEAGSYAPPSGLAKSAPQTARAATKIPLKTAATIALAAGTGLLAAFHGISPLVLIVAAGSMLSIVIHEAAHLVVARLSGDDTARRQGVSNPLKLIDPLGTLALPAFTASLTGALFGLPLVFGWAKPVPIDFNRPGNVKRSSGLIAAAGPLANAVLAAGFGAALLLHPAGLPLLALTALAKVNLLLAAFNLLPAGPQFDGFKILVSFLPQKLYARLMRNERVAPAYQGIFGKLYEGPSALLNLVGMDDQGRINSVTRLWTLAAFALFAVAAHAFLPGPALMVALVCSYDYYCIREKIQNEAAVKALTDILQGFASELALAAEQDETIQSTINTEEVEHVLKNALEDTIDKVMDSDGFDGLTEEQKWERFQAAYADAAVNALHAKGMSADSPETIRAFLNKNGSRFFEQVKGWVHDYEVFTKWHSPARKARASERTSARRDKLGSAGKAMAVLAAVGLGAHFGLGHGLAALGLGLAGIIMPDGSRRSGPSEPAAQPAPAKAPTFQEAMEDPNLKLDTKTKAFLSLLLSEMKLDEKPPVIGRIGEMGDVYKNVVAPRGGINSVVLIGKAGVGKTAIAEKLAQALALSELQPDGTFALTKMRGRHLMKLNLSRLLSQDDPPKALDALIGIIQSFNDANKRSGNKVVLFIDEIHQLFLHDKGPLMANMLKEALRDGSLTIIAATTEAEYKKFIESDDAFNRRMIPVPVAESSVEETLRMLQGAKSYYEGLYGSLIEPEAMKTAVELSKYDQALFLPGRAFHPLTEALKEADYDTRRDSLSLAISDAIGDLQYVLGRLSEELQTTDRVTEKIKTDEPTTIDLYNAAIELSKKLVALYRERGEIPTEGQPHVTADLVKKQITKKTGVKSGMLTLGQEPMDRYLNMEATVGKRVIGQPDALRAIAEAVRRNKAGLSDPKRPLGVFYLTGPTGSGKTHLAKELARFLFDDPEAVIRVDMSEYMESHTVSKFIGSPPGYVGYGEGGQLTERVRKKPYSVVLFDEIEKAHPDVWLLMLQILGDGRLTDGQGRTVDFKNTIILMTSNLGMYALNDMLEPYVQQFRELQAKLDAARAAGQTAEAAGLEQEQRALAEKLSAETQEKTQAVTKEAFAKTYPPEFEGRLSAPPIVFHRITPEMAESIVKLNLKELTTVLDYAGHELAEPSPAVVKFLVEKGFDVRLGARPLQNAIDRYVSAQLARRLLESAQAHGNRPQPSRVTLSVKNGTIAVDVTPLPPRVVAKKDAGEGAAQEVFTQALNLAMKAASDKVAPEAALEVVDAWVQAAISAYPELESKPEINGVASVSSQPSAPQVNTPAPVAVAAPTAIAVSPSREVEVTAGLFQQTPAPILGATAVKKTAAHYEIERKDPNLKELAKDLDSALTQSGYPEATKQALLRTIEDQSNPHLGWLKLFVEQAKKMTPNDRRATNVQAAFEVSDSAVRVIIHRNGPLGDKELAVLRTHFAGQVPVDAAAARDKAEALNVMGKDGRRLFFDLYRVLSDMPGARLGVATGAQAQGGAGTDYWIELAKPTAPEPETEAPPPPPQQAEAGPPSAALAPQDTASPPASEGFPAGLVQRATTAPIVARPEQRTLNVEAAEANDPEIRKAIGLGMTKTGGYSKTARIGAMNFLSAVGGFLRDRAVTVGNNQPLTLAWEVTPQQTTLIFRTNGRALNNPEIAALQEMFQTRSNLRSRITESGGQVFVGDGEQSLWDSGASIWVVFPAEARSQADGFAGATPAAVSPASDAAPAQSPLSAAAAVPVLDPARGGSGLLDADGGAAVVVRDFAVRMSGQGYDAVRRDAVEHSVTSAMTFMLDRAREGQPVRAGWESDGRLARFLLSSEGPDFDENALSRLRALFNGTDLGRGLAAAGGRVFHHGASVWVEVARSGAVAVPAQAPAAAPAAEGRHSVALDVMKHNPQDPAFRQAQKDVEAELRRRFGEPSSDLKILTRRFLDRAARFAKESARMRGESIFLEWRVRADGQLEVGVRRESPQPKSFLALQWQASIQQMTGMLDLMTAVGASLVNEPVAVAGKHSHKLALLLPRPGSAPASAAPSAPAAAQAPAAAPQAPSRHADKAREMMRRFAKAVLAQGDARGPTVLYAAGDLLGAVSTPEDLAKARQDVVDGRTNGNWAMMAAAAAIVAGQGNRSDDEQRLRLAVSNASWGSEHLLNPMRRRVAEALAKILATDNPERLAALAAELKGIEEDEAGDQLLAYALYLALARHGGPDVEELLIRRYSNSRSAALADYLRRNDPEFLRRLYLKWRTTKSIPEKSGDRALTLYALGDYGEPADLGYFTRLVRTKWDSDLAFDQIPIAALAFGRYLARHGLYNDDVRRELKTWLETPLDKWDEWHKAIAAGEAIGQAGSDEDIDDLDKMIRFNPGDVSASNEITQAAAAEAWARMVNRLGLIDRYLTENEPGAEGQPPQPRIVKMLTDRNAIVNKAAMEAVRLYLTEPRRAMQAAAPARPAVLGEQRDHPRFTLGPVTPSEGSYERFSRPDEDAAGDPVLGPWLLRLSDARLTAIKAWSAAMTAVLEPLLGGAVIGRDIRTFMVDDEAAASTLVAWVLLQDRAPAVPAGAAARAKELTLLLLHLMQDSEAVREAKLAQLEREVPGARRAYEATAAVAAIPGARFGLDFSEDRGFGGGQSPFKLWLSLDGSSFGPKPDPQH